MFRRACVKVLRLPVVDDRDVGQKPVAAAGDGFDETRILRRISQRLADLADRFVETVIKIHDRLRPKLAMQFLPGHQLARLVQQHRQQLKRLLLQPDAFAVLGEFAGSKSASKTPNFKRLEDCVACVMANLRVPKIRRFAACQDRVNGCPVRGINTRNYLNLLCFLGDVVSRKIGPAVH